jgi:hypothetical protein
LRGSVCSEPWIINIEFSTNQVYCTSRKIENHPPITGGELGEGREGAERRDDGEAERRRWTGLPARRSGGVSANGWRRTVQGALVGCSGAEGARDCGCEAAEVADDSE